MLTKLKTLIFGEYKSEEVIYERDLSEPTFEFHKWYYNLKTKQL